MCISSFLQKLAMTLKAKPVGKGESSAGPTSFVDKLRFVYDKYDPDNDGLDINEFKNAMETEGVEGMPLPCDPSKLVSILSYNLRSMNQNPLNNQTSL